MSYYNGAAGIEVGSSEHQALHAHNSQLTAARLGLKAAQPLRESLCSSL